MQSQTCIMKFLGMKAHFVVRVEELPKAGLLGQVNRLPARAPSPFEASRKKGAWFEVKTGGFLARMALMAGSASNSSARKVRTASRFQPRGWANSR